MTTSLPTSIPFCSSASFSLIASVTFVMSLPRAFTIPKVIACLEGAPATEMREYEVAFCTPSETLAMSRTYTTCPPTFKRATLPMSATESRLPRNAIAYEMPSTEMEPIGSDAFDEAIAATICDREMPRREMSSLRTTTWISLSRTPETSTRETPDTPCNSRFTSSPSSANCAGGRSALTDISCIGWSEKFCSITVGVFASSGSSGTTLSTSSFSFCIDRCTSADALNSTTTTETPSRDDEVSLLSSGRFARRSSILLVTRRSTSSGEAPGKTTETPPTGIWISGVDSLVIESIATKPMRENPNMSSRVN